MKFRLLAVFAAFAMMLGLAPSIKVSPTGGIEVTSLTSAAYAKGDKGSRLWMTGATREDVVAAALRGDEPCYGSSKNHTCYSYDPVLQMFHIQKVSRPDGLNKNIVENMDVVLDGQNVVVRRDGVPMILFQVASEQQNAAAIWNTALANMLPAAVNGMGAAGIQALASCHGSCGGPQVVNVVGASATNTAVSTSALNAALSGGAGGCTSCGAPVTDPKAH
jgi:hypothetical protein